MEGGVPATIGSSGDGGLSAPAHQQPPAPPQAHVNGGGGGEVGDDRGSIAGEEGDRNSGGNRWPKQETLALIKIRSEMDAAFRDSNLKGPLWDDVSRKLSELGFHRSAKKCREKFENVYKYHRRTKEGRTSKSDKTYRFFDQLQALEATPRAAFPPPPPPPLAAVKPPPPIFTGMSNSGATHPLPVTVPSFNLTGSDQNNVSPISVAAPAVPPLPAMNHKRTFPFSQPNMSGSTNSDESYTSSDEEPPRKKRKWQEFFGKLMNEVIEKQEELQMKFLDTLERRERDRVAREEAWRAQEIAKMNQEHERLVKERSVAAAKDAAVITLLQKMTGKTPDATSVFPVIQQQQQIQKSPLSLPPPPSPHHQVLPTVAVAVPVSAPPLPPAPPIQVAVAPPAIQAPAIQVAPPVAPAPSVAPPAILSVAPPMVKNLDGGGGEIVLSPSPSRWPKAEINALINLRTQLDTKYQENVPKGPLWEDISAAMRKLGYNRNAKRCKEKWENINKYYKKMKEGNKKRPEDSKTCPYFHQLDAIYSGKANNNNETKMTAIVARPEQQWPPAGVVTVQEKAPTPQQRSMDAIYMDKVANNLGFAVKPETQTTPVAAWSQQQWLLPTGVHETPRQPPHQQQSTVGMDDQGSGNDDYDDDDDDDDDEEDDDDEDDGGDEIVPNKTSSMAAV